MIPELSAAARRRCWRERLHYGNIFFKVGRGQEGWPEFAPFDRIILTAAPAEFPEALFGAAGRGRHRRRPGRRRRASGWSAIEKRHGSIHAEDAIGVIFVPLV